MGGKKQIVFIRHAEGFHNAAAKYNKFAYFSSNLLDADLSPEGFNQCGSFACAYSDSDIIKDVELVVVSPMRRTMRTAYLCLENFLDKVPFVAHENVREITGLFPCDQRSSVADLKKEFPKISFQEGVNSNEDPLYSRYRSFLNIGYREPLRDVVARAKEFFKWLERRPEKKIVIVTHSQILSAVLKHVVVDQREVKKFHFENCEFLTCSLELPSLALN